MIADQNSDTTPEEIFALWLGMPDDPAALKLAHLLRKLNDRDVDDVLWVVLSKLHARGLLTGEDQKLIDELLREMQARRDAR